MTETRCRIAGSIPYATVPGHAVGPVSRCPAIAGSVTTRPALNSGLPAEVSTTCESGSTCATSSRHASRRTSAFTIAGGGETDWKFPISETPTVPLLKPSAWAPITLRSIPPARPSYTVPYRSIKKL